MKKLIVPPEYVIIDAPLVFLAGPIQGASNWQSEAVGLISQKAPELYVASPRRDGVTTEFSQEEFNAQMDWETFYLRKAGVCGVVMFWLAKEIMHNCDRAYAQTSRFELGEWKVRHECVGALLVVGVEEGFTNARYVVRRLEQDCPDVPVGSTLEETCRLAVRVARMVKRDMRRI